MPISPAVSEHSGALSAHCLFPVGLGMTISAYVNSTMGKKPVSHRSNQKVIMLHLLLWIGLASAGLLLRGLLGIRPRTFTASNVPSPSHLKILIFRQGAV